MEPFAPRHLRFLGVRHHDEWRLKLYSVVYGEQPLDLDAFEPGLDLALAALPSPDPAAGRPGLGFVITHQGKTGDYVVLAWWDQENELPVRVWVRRDRSGPFRPARGSESFCVWDLEILWRERQAWVDTMLISSPSPTAYLERAVAGASTTSRAERPS